MRNHLPDARPVLRMAELLATVCEPFPHSRGASSDPRVFLRWRNSKCVWRLRSCVSELGVKKTTTNKQGKV